MGKAGHAVVSLGYGLSTDVRVAPVECSTLSGLWYDHLKSGDSVAGSDSQTQKFVIHDDLLQKFQH